MDMEEKKNNKLVPGIILGVLVGAGATVGCFAYDHMKDKEIEPATITKEEYKKTKEYKETNMVETFKDYYTSKGFVMVNNVESWDVEIKEEKDDYVVFESTYTCKDGNGDCIYVSQEEKKDDKYVFTIKANGKYENYKFNITSIEGPSIEEKKEETQGTTVQQPSEPIAQQPTKETTELDYDTYSKLLLEYLTSKGLIFKPNLSMFRPDVFTYKGYYASKPNEKWYEVHGHYTCLDGNSECVYQEQGGEEDNGAYTFSYYIIVSDGQIVNISGMVTTEGLIK